MEKKKERERLLSEIERLREELAEYLRNRDGRGGDRERLVRISEKLDELIAEFHRFEERS